MNAYTHVLRASRAALITCAWLGGGALNAAAQASVPPVEAAPSQVSPLPAAAADPAAQADSPAPGLPPLPATVLPATGSSHHQPDEELDLEQWSRDDWMLVKPRVSLLEVDGYFRLRSKLFRRMDFGNSAVLETNRFGETIRRYPPYHDGQADLSYTNMRLRVEPVINISDQLQIVTTVDFFDNLVLGSTPDSLTFGQTDPPLNIASRSQLPPQQGRNAKAGGIAVKRLWGRATALGEQLELRFGRMPNHFGLGMLYNDGDGLDCDYGQAVDRVALSFRLYNHVFTPMIDWVSRGPQVQPFGPNDPQPVDAVAWDDTMQYSVRMTREDHPADIRDTTTHGGSVLNYGVSNAFRQQPRDYDAAFWSQGYDPNRTPGSSTAAAGSERRDAFLYIGDAFARYYTGHLAFAAEAAVLAGSFTDTLLGATLGTAGPATKTSIFALGGALEASYHARADRKGMLLGMKAGAASGDNHAGFGALDLRDTQRGPGDAALHNFEFSPDYHLDLLLFRRILGTVTDAWYVRPEVAYRFDERLQGRLNAVYSQAIRTGSTPSARNGGAPQAPLGVEIDAQLSFGLPFETQRNQLLAALEGGILFPLAGLQNGNLTTGTESAGSFAWTLQASMALTF